MPLWQHGLRCTVGVAACLGASVLISRALHKQADKVQAGEVQLQPPSQLSSHYIISIRSSVIQCCWPDMMSGT